MTDPPKTFRDSGTGGAKASGSGSKPAKAEPHPDDVNVPRDLSEDDRHFLEEVRERGEAPFDDEPEEEQ